MIEKHRGVSNVLIRCDVCWLIGYFYSVQLFFLSRSLTLRGRLTPLIGLHDTSVAKEKTHTHE